MKFISLPLLLLAATVAISTPVLAQDTPTAAAPADEAAVADEAISPEEAAFNERSAALGRRVLEVEAEMKAAARTAAADPEAAEAQLDRLETGFQVEMDAFIRDLIGFAAWKEASLSPDEREAQRRGVEGMVVQLAVVPESLRRSAEAAAAPTPETTTEPAQAASEP
ncbi:MAG: hypothetical protein KJ824_12325 [Alphaproteobacteria bacterium]|nr:hypothetical protein [Alphaproteobacteria bacterium]